MTPCLGNSGQTIPFFHGSSADDPMECRDLCRNWLFCHYRGPHRIFEFTMPFAPGLVDRIF